MTISDVELNLDEKRRSRTRNAVEKLRQSAEVLAVIHSQGKVLDKPIQFYFIPRSAGEKVYDITPDVSEPNECANERPAEEKDSGPSQAGDIFSVGCYFYYVITGGQHPFGKPGYRTLFIANNLYDLTACRDGPLKKLIARMICHDSTKRPSSSELLNHPYLWKEDRAESYLATIAENLDENSEKYQIWKGTVLFSFDLHAFEFDMVRETSIVKSILRILVEIKEKKETAINACQLFPDLLSTVYFNENPDVILGEIDDSCPETFGNVLIANGCFAEVQPVIGIKRRHGRFGTQPVHVMQFPYLTDDTVSLMTRLSCLNHPNLLQYFYLDENSEKNLLVLACEPFDETLDTWMATNSQSISFETAKEILTQITTGLVYYHSNNLIHGNLTSSQIAITNSGTIIAKISKFPIDESMESPSPTRQNDVRKLGHIYSDLLQRVKDVPLCTAHLLKSMKDTKDECTPPSDAVFYHPFFWSSEETAEFLLTSGDFYEDNLTIDRNLSVGTTTSLIPEYQHLETSRSAIKYFLSLATNESAAEDPVMLAAQFNKHFPMLATQTWLRLQTFKMTEDNFGLGSFYHPFYDFPTYEELTRDERMASEVVEKKSHSPKDESEGTASMKVALPDEGFCEEFEICRIEKFQQQNEKELQVPQLIQNYLKKYVHKWEIAEKSHTVTRKMKHPAIDDIGRTAMHLACYSDDFYESATKLIELGFDPNTPDKNGYVPLHFAALNNSIEIAKLLIENCAIIDTCDLNELRTPLFLAAIANCFVMLQFLIGKNANTNQVDAFGLSPLHIAVASNANDSNKVAELLLKYRANVNALDREGNTPLHIAVSKNKIDIVQLLLKHKADPNIVAKNMFGGVLHLAVANFSLDILHLLLTSNHTNPNLVNFQGMSALHFAAFLSVKTETRHAAQQIVEMLIAFGANPNAIDRLGISVLHFATINQAEDVVERLLKTPNIIVDPIQNETRVTPLHLAAWFNFENIARMLIEGGADTGAEDYNGETPLEYAVSSNAVAVVKTLLNNGAEANSRRWKERSPLHVAAAHGTEQIAKLLIAKGANVNALDEFGLTPLHYAEYRNHVTFVKFLRLQPGLRKAPKSKPLDPAELALLPQLTNGVQQSSIPAFHIELPASLVPNIDSLKVTVSQKVRIVTSNTI
ncbi:ankyrin repeat protein [Daphnia sinensis]|uniref:Ankyrin repeat protein n=1 Tax=Daphnia sinensis TaxID=1820382 RepID=A0AAD5LXH4_9CRUS|nr:ankyrin repeat protein [Daphnia sinensis]